MAVSCFKYFLFVQSVSALCKEKECQALLPKEPLVLVQNRAVQVKGKAQDKQAVDKKGEASTSMDSSLEQRLNLSGTSEGFIHDGIVGFVNGVVASVMHNDLIPEGDQIAVADAVGNAAGEAVDKVISDKTQDTIQAVEHQAEDTIHVVQDLSSGKAEIKLSLQPQVDEQSEISTLSEVCNWECYLYRYPDLQQAFGATNTESAEAHYQALGQSEGRDCSCPFSCNWQCYLNRYPDLQEAFGATNTAAAESHYQSTGHFENRDCYCPFTCNWQCYLDRYPDLQEAFGATNTLAAEDHYQSTGQSENRDCFCPFPCNWECYLDRYPDLKEAFGAWNTLGAESHYESTGKSEGRDCVCPY